jgi:hypothetical protein
MNPDAVQSPVEVRRWFFGLANAAHHRGTVPPPPPHPTLLED